MANFWYKTFGEDNVKRAGRKIDKAWKDFTGVTAAEQAAATAEKQMAEQERYAREGLQWKVQDATKAGIHPLYALGGSGPSYSPVSIDTPVTSDIRSGMELLELGNSISRTFSDREKKIAQLQLRSAELDVADKEMDLRIKGDALRKLNSPGNVPGFDPGTGTGQGIAGQSSTNSLINEVPMERTTGAPGAPHQEPGARTFTGFARTQTGWMPVPSKDTKEAIEDMMIPETVAGLKMYLGPNFQPDPPKGVSVPKGMELRWIPWAFEYRLVRKGTFRSDDYGKPNRGKEFMK